MKRSFQSHVTEIVVSTIKGVAIVSISAVVTILAARLVGGPQLSINQTSTQKESTFDVTGETEISVVPDEAQINLGVQTNNATVTQAQEEINSKINAITEKLKQLGIDKEKIKTQNYSIYPDYNYSPDEIRQIIGYNASVTVRVTVTDFEKLNQIIDESTSLGANQVGGISFGISDKQEKKLKSEARKDAIQDAKKNAQELAHLSGMKLGRIVNIWESPHYSPDPQPYGRAEMMLDSMGGAAEPTRIEPGSTNYTYAVTLSFETL